MKLNGSFYIDYQDCHFVGNHYMLCGGLKGYSIKGLGNFAFGGVDLIDIRSLLPVHQIPVRLHLKPGLVMTRNPFYFEIINERLRFYFIPEDGESKIYIYEVIN